MGIIKTLLRGQSCTTCDIKISCWFTEFLCWTVLVFRFFYKSSHLSSRPVYIFASAFYLKQGFHQLTVWQFAVSFLTFTSPQLSFCSLPFKKKKVNVWATHVFFLCNEGPEQPWIVVSIKIFILNCVSQVQMMGKALKSVWNKKQFKCMGPVVNHVKKEWDRGLSTKFYEHSNCPIV